MELAKGFLSKSIKSLVSDKMSIAGMIAEEKRQAFNAYKVCELKEMFINQWYGKLIEDDGTIVVTVRMEYREPEVTWFFAKWMIEQGFYVCLPRSRNQPEYRISLNETPMQIT